MPFRSSATPGTSSSSTKLASRGTEPAAPARRSPGGCAPEFQIVEPLLEHLAVELRTVSLGVGNDLALRQCGEQAFGNAPLQEPAKRHGDHVVEVDVVEVDDLVRHGGPKCRDATGMDGHPLPANQIGQRSPVEKIDLDLVVLIGSRHLLRPPNLARKAVGLEVPAPAVEFVEYFGDGS